MRLLYQHIVQNISKEDCQIIIDDLKGHVATSFKLGKKDTKKNMVYRFLTTSRPVEVWLQKVEDGIKLMSRKKVPFEFWMVTGGYGAGKSHMKEYLRRNEINRFKFLEPKIILSEPPKKISFLDFSQSPAGDMPPVYDIFSLILLQTRPFLDVLRDDLKKRQPLQLSRVREELGKTARDYPVDDDFVDAFCGYAGLDGVNNSDFHALEELIINKGEQLFLPLMELYKKYLGVNGFCVFIDEFESLQFLDKSRRMAFVQSIRPFYDAIASTRSNPNLPSLKMIILCTLSFWNELTRDASSQALETRISLFEIPPLVEDEIISLAEKIYIIHNKSGYPAPQFDLNFNKLPPYLVHRAGIEAPLTPRFVINEIITIIEKPNDYLEFRSKS